MKLDEIKRRTAELKGVTLLADSRTYSHKVPFSPKNTFFFVRPLADDLVLMTSVMKSTDAASVELGEQILATAEPLAAKSRASITSKLAGHAFNVPNFDSLLLVGPAVLKFSMMKGAEFLTPITVGAFAVNHIEFSGEETEAEAVVRRQHAIVADVTREITPVIFLRYHKQTGQRSAEHLAIAKHDYTTKLINEIPRDGGTVELENYERIRMSFSGDKGETNLDVTFDGKTKKLPVAEAVKQMDALTYKGAEVAKKDW